MPKSLLLALLLFSCQITPPTPTVPTEQSLASAKDSVLLGASATENLVGSRALVKGADRDGLNIHIQIHRIPMRIQALDIQRIQWLSAKITAPGHADPYRNEGGLVAAEAAEQRLTIVDVPKGPNRIVTLEAYTEDREGHPVLLPDVTLKAMYSSHPDIHQVEVAFTVYSTLAVNIMEHVVASAPHLAETLNGSDLETLVHTIALGGTPPSDSTFSGTPIAPGRIDPAQVAEAIIATSGSMPVLEQAVPETWLYPASEGVAITAHGPAEKSYYRSKILLQITDPFSPTQAILPGTPDLTRSFAHVPPGDWELVAMLQDEQGIIRAQERLKLHVPHDGGSPTFRNESDQLVAPSLVLPPLLQYLQDRQGNTIQDLPIGAPLVLSGDGFDAANPEQNVVTIQGVVAVRDVTAPYSEHQLTVTVPPQLRGNDLSVVVTTRGKASNALNLNLLPSVTAVEPQSVNMSLSPSNKSVTLTLLGLNPNDYPQLKLQFMGIDGQWIVSEVTPTGKTETTLTALLPSNVGTGAIRVIPAPGATPLLSPSLAVLRSGPEITSEGHPVLRNGTFIAKGLNFAPGAHSNGTPYTSLTFLGTITLPGGGATTPVHFFDSRPANTYRVRDDQTIEIDVAPGVDFLNDGGTYRFMACVTIDGVSLGCDESTFTLRAAPKITSAPVTVGSQAPLIISGSHFFGATTVTVGGTVFSESGFTVSPDGKTITVANPPAIYGVTPLSLTTPDGDASFQIIPLSATYQQVVNLVGPTTYMFNNTGPHSYPMAQWPEVVGRLPLYQGYTPHGVTVDSCTGDFYVIDHTGGRIFKHNATGLSLWHLGPGPNTLASGLVNGEYGGGDVALFRQNLRFAGPEDAAIKADGTLYVADMGNNQIRVVNGRGTRISTLPLNMTIQGPQGVALSADERYLYITSNTTSNSSEYNPANLSRVLRVDLNTLVGSQHPVTVVAGGSQRPDAATGSEPIAGATFHHLEGIARDAAGNLYVAEVNQRQIRKIDMGTGQVSVLVNFPMTPAFSLHEIRIDSDGNILVPGEMAYQIYQVSPQGQISLIAGESYGLQSGPVHTARFRQPTGIDLDAEGNLYVADFGWGVRKINRIEPLNPLRHSPHCLP